MSVGMRAAFKQVFRDKDFLSKYTILVLLSFCNGLVTFSMLAKNYAWLAVAIPLSIFASMLLYGYMLKYVQDLINNKDANLPEWKDCLKYLLVGLRYISAVLILCILVGLIFIIPALLILILATINKYFSVLFFIPIVLCLVAEIFILIASPSFIYTFLDSNQEVLSLLNVKKVCSYFSVNYFIALFASFVLMIVVSFLGNLAIIRLKYALFYIIPLMLSPISGLIINNMIAQAYRANKNNEKGHITSMLGYLGELILLAILFCSVILILKIKYNL